MHIVCGMLDCNCEFVNVSGLDEFLNVSTDKE